MSEKNGSKATILHKKDHAEAPVRLDSLLPTSRNRKARPLPPDERKREIAKMLEQLKTLKPRPLRPIKQVELYCKWGPLLPKEAAAVTCPKPSEEVIKLVRETKNVKSRKKAKEKKGVTQTQGKKRKLTETTKTIENNIV